jgi:hypothetical protein
MTGVLDLPPPRKFPLKIVALSCVGTALLGWGGLVLFEKMQQRRRESDPNTVVRTYRGVAVTNRMMAANRIFRHAFDDPAFDHSEESRKSKDGLAVQYINQAIDEYGANPRRTFPSILLGKLQLFQDMAGGRPTPEMTEAMGRLRSMSFEE